ncbi:MAG: DUF2490 domain-containing protein [Candidatus Omnitrophota bacterium]
MLKNKLSYLSLLLLICSGIFYFSPRAFCRDDWQFNNNYSFEYALSEKVDLGLLIEGRLNNDAGNFYYYHFQPGITCHISDFFDLGLGYRYIKKEKAKEGKDIWDDEHRLLIDPVVNWQLSEFKFSNQFRFEYRYFDLDKDCWRYRNKLKVKKNLKLGEFEFSPYISDEIFYDFNTDEFCQNRLEVGFERKIAKQIKASLFYRIQSERAGRDWDEVNVIGLKFKIDLGGKKS